MSLSQNTTSKRSIPDAGKGGGSVVPSCDDGTLEWVIKHSSGLCISAEPTGQGGSPAMKPCSAGSREQQWMLESNGNLHAEFADNKLCLAVQNWEGPAVTSPLISPKTNLVCEKSSTQPKSLPLQATLQSSPGLKKSTLLPLQSYASPPSSRKNENPTRKNLYMAQTSTGWRIIDPAPQSRFKIAVAEQDVKVLSKPKSISKSSFLAWLISWSWKSSISFLCASFS